MAIIQECGNKVLEKREKIYEKNSPLAPPPVVFSHLTVLLTNQQPIDRGSPDLLGILHCHFPIYIHVIAHPYSPKVVDATLVKNPIFLYYPMATRFDTKTY